MMKLIMEFYEKSVALTNNETDINSLVMLPVREKIGRFKYIPENETEEKYNEIKTEITTEIKELVERGE